MKRDKFFGNMAAMILAGTMVMGLGACGSEKEISGSEKEAAEAGTAEIAKKQILTLGGVSLEEDMLAAIVEFNKQSEKYTIEVRDYAPSIEWTEEGASDTYYDAVTRLYLDVMANKAPDMLVAKDVNLDVFAEKGIIADLSPFLEKSEAVGREDVFESVLNAHVKNDILCTIPAYFTVTTVVGRAAELGETPGWTLDEMLAYAGKYPDADIYSRINRSTLLHYSIRADMDSYVDFESGECYFDTTEFKEVLEFAASYSDAVDFTKSEAEVLANHEALLSMQTFGQPQDWQISEMKFAEPICAIGFPTSNSNGILADGGKGVCISANSPYQDGAWSFIEFLLSEEQQQKYVKEKLYIYDMQFPMRHSAFDAMMEAVMTPDYLCDEAGNILLDGETPMELPKASVSSGSGVYEIYAMSQEEADRLLSMIDHIDGLMAYDQQLLKIVFEEVAPYFEGKKTADEVMDIIQNRAQIYMKENRQQ